MTSLYRWTRLSALLLAVERGVEASARLDAYVPVQDTIGVHHQGLKAFDVRLRQLEARVERELDRLTVERLRLDLAVKQYRALAVAG